jgi:hypothetical protein
MFKEEAVVFRICYPKPLEHAESTHKVKPGTSHLYQPAGALTEVSIRMLRHPPEANSVTLKMEAA